MSKQFLQALYEAYHCRKTTKETVETVRYDLDNIMLTKAGMVVASNGHRMYRAQPRGLPWGLVSGEPASSTTDYVLVLGSGGRIRKPKKGETVEAAQDGFDALGLHWIWRDGNYPSPANQKKVMEKKLHDPLTHARAAWFPVDPQAWRALRKATPRKKDWPEWPGNDNKPDAPYVCVDVGTDGVFMSHLGHGTLFRLSQSGPVPELEHFHLNLAFIPTRLPIPTDIACVSSNGAIGLRWGKATFVVLGIIARTPEE